LFYKYIIGEIMINENIVNNYKKLLVSEGALGTAAGWLGRFLGRGTGKAIRAAKSTPGKVIGGGLVGAGLGYAGYQGYKALKGSTPSLGGGEEESVAKSLTKSEEKKARKAQLKSMQTRLRQEMSNIRTAGGDGDDVAIRAQAIKNLSADQDFVGQANELGYSVGKVGGSESGMFGYRHETGKDAEKSRKESEQRLRQLNPITPEMQAQAAANKAAIAAAREVDRNPPRQESRATHYGRLAQRGVNIFKEPRSVDDQLLRQAAERDIEREGPLTGFKDRVAVMKGMEERGFEIGGGDDYALFKEKEAAKKEANNELERLTAQYGDQPIPQQEVDAVMQKRNKTVDFADQNIGRINPRTKIRR
jgi:uncharacterized protein YnzC (UPF0291/DUF896 family)